LFLGSFALYLSTAAPTVTFWDSGELVAASYTLGISHQPGYPFFCIAGKLFSFIPLGNIAYRLNLLSAVFSSLTVTVVYFTILDILRGHDGVCVYNTLPPPPCSGAPHLSIFRGFAALRWPIKGGGIYEASSAKHDILPIAIAALLALVLSVVRSFWSEAVVTEVYALNAFFVSVLVMLYVKARSGSLSAARYIALSGFLFGLGLVNHESLILYLPALILTWALVPGGPRLEWTVAAFVFLALGLSVYAYLPIRSLAGPGLNIGHPDTPSNFWWTIKWGEYLRHAGGYPASALALLTKARIGDPRLVLGFVAAAFFVWRLLKSNLRLHLPLVVYLAVYTAGISAQVLGGAEEAKFGLAAKFFIPSFILVVILIGAAAGMTSASRGGRRAGAGFAVVLGLAVAVLASRNYFSNNYSRNYMAYDYAGNSLKSAGERGVLFTWGDNGVFPLWYLQTVERYRDDVVLIHVPLMTYDWYLRDVDRELGSTVGFMDTYFLGENVFRVLKAARPDRTVAYDYSSTHFLKLDMSKLGVRGLVYFEGAAPPGDPWPSYIFRGVGDRGVFKGGMEKNITAIYVYLVRASGKTTLPWH